jgi:hypothetical protein
MSSSLRWLLIRFYDWIRDPQAAGVATAPPSTSGLAELAGHRYCVVVSYRANGAAIPTTVWFGLADGSLYFRSPGAALKLKRIRKNPAVRIAPSNIRGRPRGAPVECQARILETNEHARAEEAIAANYGLFRRLYMRAFAASEKQDDVYVEVKPLG